MNERQFSKENYLATVFNAVVSLADGGGMTKTLVCSVVLVGVG